MSKLALKNSILGYFRIIDRTLYEGLNGGNIFFIIICNNYTWKLCKLSKTFGLLLLNLWSIRDLQPSTQTR